MWGEAGITNSTMSDDTFDATTLAETLFRKEWLARLPHIAVNLFGEIAITPNILSVELDNRFRDGEVFPRGLESTVWEEPEPWTDQEVADQDAEWGERRERSEYEGAGAREMREDSQRLEFKKLRFEHDQKALGLQPGHTVEVGRPRC